MKTSVEIRIGELQGIISTCETRIKELKDAAHGRAETVALAHEYRQTYEKIMMDAEVELLRLQVNNKT